MMHFVFYVFSDVKWCTLSIWMYEYRFVL